MSAKPFFSKEDLGRARRWQPGTLGAAPAPREAPAAAAARAARAREQGYREGFAAGEAAAREAAERLSRLATSLGRELQGREDQVAQAALDLALAIARQIVRTEIKASREALLPAVRDALDCLPQSTKGAQLLVHPSDVDLVRAHIGDDLTQGAWRIAEDHRVEPGGCRIVAPHCEIDATLATRWKRVIATMGRDAPWIETEANAR
ncbi:MAG: flagellar assembly protein FliH [Burkholderiales bacterium]|nr:flagellar assembly protein FliH [Burkholderiales bacterium]